MVKALPAHGAELHAPVYFVQDFVYTAAQRCTVAITVNINEAKTHLSRLLARVQAGEEVVIARAGKPVARLVPMTALPARRQPGSAAGKLVVPDDFNAPLPEEVLKDFDT